MRTIWIFNHYAGNMFIVGGGRHYYLAKYLKQGGYSPVVFCSNYDHFTHNNCVESDNLWIEKQDLETKVPYVFIKTREYPNNGLRRILNMMDYFWGLLRTVKQYVADKERPDVIYASSVHPLTLVAGILIAKYFGVKCISEVRDLWPESIVAYSSRWTRENPIIRVLYAGEKWIYKKSDYIIMTWAGGYDYISDQGWQKDIPKQKVYHISNGVDLEPYLKNINEYPYKDADLSDKTKKNFIYTGSIRKVNNISLLVESALELKKMNNSIARILVYGDGDELESLKRVVDEQQIDNIVFKGRVPKEYIPSILSQGYASILHNSSTELNKYGQSQNKFFEYLAAGRPVLMTYSVGHSIIEKYGCGIELDSQNPKSIALAISSLCDLTENDYKNYCQIASNCAKRFDYKKLYEELITLINNI